MASFKLTSTDRRKLKTGLGDAKSVKCNVCGKEKEITDVSNW